ncbi:MAG TPA: SPOR domain-containing protein, partial [Gammaproteobacteria bacterium]|nr:SPOR domain-containing protein [Gammaproteobacteria bacterium]
PRRFGTGENVMAARQKPKKRKPVRRGGTAPIWFVAGALLAVLIIFGYPAVRNAVQHRSTGVAQQGGAPAGGRQENPAAAATTGESFDFYRMLSHPTQILTSGETAEVQPAKPAQSVAEPGSYILQVASFRAAKDAEALKAQLALWGVSAEVQAVTVQGETWHRVRIGPVSDLASLNAMRSRLAAHKLKPLLIRTGN